MCFLMPPLGLVFIAVNFSNSNGTITENTRNLAKSLLFHQVTVCIASGYKVELKE